MIPPLDRKPDPTPAPPPKRYPFDRVTSCCAGQIRQLPPMPPEVRRLVEAVATLMARHALATKEKYDESAWHVLTGGASAFSNAGPSADPFDSMPNAIAAVRRIFRSEP